MEDTMNLFEIMWPRQRKGSIIFCVNDVIEIFRQRTDSADNIYELL